MKKRLMASVLALSLLALSGCGGNSSKPADNGGAPAENSGEPQANTTISGSFLMGTGSATGNYYAFGSVLSQIINSHTGSNITVSATGGSVENVRLLSSGEIGRASCRERVLRLV